MVVCITLRTGISSCPPLKTARLQSPPTRDRENQVGELLSKSQPTRTETDRREEKVWSSVLKLIYEEIKRTAIPGNVQKMLKTLPFSPVKAD